VQRIDFTSGSIRSAQEKGETMISSLQSLLMIAFAGVLLNGHDSGAQNTSTTTKQGAKTRATQPFRIFNPETMAKPTAGYSQVAEVNDGKIIYIAGQVALDKSGNLVGKDDFPAQVQQVFENLRAAVEAAGGDFKSVIKLNYYCVGSVDSAQLPVVREIRDKYVNTANPPTSTFVFVQRLVRPEWLIEVDAVAVVKK
jgi:enamine deaminase RidA (YjgF/YER057c/UK114 family)